MKIIAFATCIAFVLLMGISEAFSDENNRGSQQEKDIQRTAEITGDSIDVVKK